MPCCGPTPHVVPPWGIVGSTGAGADPAGRSATECGDTSEVAGSSRVPRCSLWAHRVTAAPLVRRGAGGRRSCREHPGDSRVAGVLPGTALSLGIGSAWRRTAECSGGLGAAVGHIRPHSAGRSAGGCLVEFGAHWSRSARSVLTGSRPVIGFPAPLGKDAGRNPAGSLWRCCSVNVGPGAPGQVRLIGGGPTVPRRLWCGGGLLPRRARRVVRRGCGAGVSVRGRSRRVRSRRSAGRWPGPRPLPTSPRCRAGVGRRNRGRRCAFRSSTGGSGAALRCRVMWEPIASA